MRNYLLAIITVFLFAFSSCSKKGGTTGGGSTTNPTDSNLPAETISNVPYGSNSLQKMDIYLPAKRTATATKVMLLIHGGAWMEGDKSDADFAPVVDSIKKRFPDWAIININYRLSNLLTNNFPAQENDIKTAIKYVFDKRNEYAISDKWVYAGASAGGHLALLQGYKDTSIVKPKAIVNYFGPSDLNKMIADETDATLKWGMQVLFNGTEITSSPINYVTTKSSPTITLQGVSDNTVPQSQQQALHAKLKANSVTEQLIIYADEGHGFTSPTMTKSYDAVTAFLNTYVK